MLYIFFITLIVILAVSTMLTVLDGKLFYGLYREDNAVNISYKKYPNLKVKFGRYPDQILNDCRKSCTTCKPCSSDCKPHMMDLRLCDFHISSAYRPYQVAGQSNDICSYEGIKLSIEKGARLHYLDVRSSNETTPYDENAYPVVRNETLMTQYGKALDFKKVCNIYKKRAWD